MPASVRRCPSDGCSSRPGSQTRGSVGQLLSRVPRRCASVVCLDLQQVSAKNGREELSQAGQAQEIQRGRLVRRSHCSSASNLRWAHQLCAWPESATRLVSPILLTASHQHRSRAASLSPRCPSPTTDALGLRICVNRSGSIEIHLATWLPSLRGVLRS